MNRENIDFIREKSYAKSLFPVCSARLSINKKRFKPFTFYIEKILLILKSKYCTESDQCLKKKFSILSRVFNNDN